jgi:predicted phage terminase large subunit-like protein
MEISESPASKLSAGSPLTPDEIEWLRNQCRESFYFFAKFVLDFQFDESWLQVHIHKELCEALQDYTVNRRLCITLPRSWLKSTVCSIYYPIWRAIRDPNVRVLIVQNSAPNAEKKLQAIRGQFETNPLLRVLFPHLLPDSSCNWTTKSACLKRTINHPENTFETAGTRTKVISRHYDLIVEDDTVAPDLDELGDENVCPTKDDINQAIGWHRLAGGLLVDFKTSQLIIVGTRWFEKDLISWNGENEPTYKRIERAVRETDGKPDPDGQITYPERFDEQTLEELQHAFGPYLFSCLYLNRPLRSDDMVFKKDWFRYYENVPRNVVCYTLVDPAGGSSKKAKAKSNPDYNVVMTVAKDLDEGHLYVVEYDRFRGTPGQLINAIFRHQATHHSVTVGIEGVQYQNSLDYFVKEQMSKRNQWFAVEMLKSVKAKEVRIRALQPLFASGSILVRTHHTELLAELETFPLGAHDDCADALSMVLQLLDITPVAGKSTDSTDYALNSLEAAVQLLQDRNKPDPNNVVAEMTGTVSYEIPDEDAWSGVIETVTITPSYGGTTWLENSE